MPVTGRKLQHKLGTGWEQAAKGPYTSPEQTEYKLGKHAEHDEHRLKNTQRANFGHKSFSCRATSSQEPGPGRK